MRLDITGRHVTVTPALRQLITKRLATLERVLNDSAISALVIVTKEKYRHKV
jgi:ribosomal subunit interface protein